VDGALVCLPVWGGNMSRKTSERTRLRIARRRRHSAFVHFSSLESTRKTGAKKPLAPEYGAQRM